MTRPLDRLRVWAAQDRLHRAFENGDGPAVSRAVGDVIPPLRRLAAADEARWGPRIGAAVAAYLYRERLWHGPPAPAPDQVRATDVAEVLIAVATTESRSSSRRSLAAAREAVDVARTIPAGNGVLPAALTRLAKSLADRGRHDDAVAAAREAVELYRRLERGSPERQGETAALEFLARTSEGGTG